MNMTVKARETGGGTWWWESLQLEQRGLHNLRPKLENENSWRKNLKMTQSSSWPCLPTQFNLCIFSPFPSLFYSFFLIFNFNFNFFLGLHQQHIEIPRLGAESELQLLAYTTAIAIQNPSRICDLHHSSQQHQNLNPLSKARDRTHVLMVTSWVHYHWATMGTPCKHFLSHIISHHLAKAWEGNSDSSLFKFSFSPTFSLMRDRQTDTYTYTYTQMWREKHLLISYVYYHKILGCLYPSENSVSWVLWGFDMLKGKQRNLKNIIPPRPDLYCYSSYYKILLCMSGAKAYVISSGFLSVTKF